MTPPVAGRFRRLLAVGAVFLFEAGFLAPSFAKKPADVVDLVIIFDTSGSMVDQVAGGTKLDIAKKAMTKFVDSLPAGVNVGMVVFGTGCDTRVAQELVKSSPQARERLKAAIASLKAEGKTPIGDALQKATGMLAASTHKIAPSLRGLLESWGAQGECTVVGTKTRAGVPPAILANGMLAHSLDFD